MCSLAGGDDSVGVGGLGGNQDDLGGGSNKNGGSSRLDISLSQSLYIRVILNRVRPLPPALSTCMPFFRTYGNDHKWMLGDELHIGWTQRMAKQAWGPYFFFIFLPKDWASALL